MSPSALSVCATACRAASRRASSSRAEKLRPCACMRRASVRSLRPRACAACTRVGRPKGSRRTIQARNWGAKGSALDRACKRAWAYWWCICASCASACGRGASSTALSSSTPLKACSNSTGQANTSRYTTSGPICA